MAETSLVSILPNLSIGVICVLGIIYIVLKFLDALDKREQRHSLAMDEREKAMRALEASVRSTLADHLTQNSVALQENTRIMERVIRRLDSSGSDR